MSAISLWGYDDLLGGKQEDEQVRVQVAAMKCKRPHIMLLRQGDGVFFFDQLRFKEALMHLPEKISLRKIMKAIQEEDQLIPLSRKDPLDVRHRVERLIKVLASEYHELP